MSGRQPCSFRKLRNRYRNSGRRQFVITDSGAPAGVLVSGLVDASVLTTEAPGEGALEVAVGDQDAEPEGHYAS